MSKKPNIIMILTDDLGYGDISCLNPRSQIHTGNIDRLAEEGMCLTDCHSSSALCTPSRYALMTGRYNWRSRLKSLVLPGHSSHLIETGRETIASLLQRSGYRTAAVGKWHLGMDWQTKNGFTLPLTYFEKNAAADLMMEGIDFTAPIQNGPTTRGFDYFYGMPASLDQPPFVHIENDRAITQPVEMIGKNELDRSGASDQYAVEYGPAEAGYDPSKIVPEMDNKVLELVDKYADGDQPFFIYYPTLAVHGPLAPSEEYKGKSGLNAYADFVLQVDGFVGRLDKLLHDKGIADDTILIFTSDNGCSPVADYPTLISKGHNPSYIYRGWKGDIWEGGHRIPFIVRWPGKIQPGTSSDALTCLVDMFATVSEITGTGYADNAGEDSVSMLPLWTGEADHTREDLVHHAAMGGYSLRKGDWKMCFCHDSNGMRPPEPKTENTPPYQLYHIDADIGEHFNLYGTQPEVEQDMLSALSRYVREGRSTPGAPQENCPNPIWPGLDFMK